MATRTDEHSRVLGGIVCLAAALGAALFLYGLSVESYWALALPVAAVTLFVLGLVFWIGWTIATIQVQASGEVLGPAGGPSAATTPDADASPEGAAHADAEGADSAPRDGEA
jgi:hypothetical protein